MAASRLTLLRAVVLAVFVWQLLVEGMTASNLGALLLQLVLCSLGLGKDIFIIIKPMSLERDRVAFISIVPATC